jgi:hypothetical protein
MGRVSTIDLYDNIKKDESKALAIRGLHGTVLLLRHATIERTEILLSVPRSHRRAAREMQENGNGYVARDPSSTLVRHFNTPPKLSCSEELTNRLPG